MQVRGAPLIGATAAYGVCLALRRDASDEALDRAIDHLAKQRPTAINLRWALEEMRAAVRNLPRQARVAAAYQRAAEIADADVETNRAIGAPRREADRGHRRSARSRARRVNVLTHCNAGWLACVDWGTAHVADLRGARRGHRRCTCGWTKRGRAIRARRSPPSSSAPTACRTPSSPTTPAGT